MTRKIINEGFWDHLVTQVKRGAYAVGAAAGSQGAAGKLSALNLSQQIYSAYKHYVGSTGAEESKEEMYHFLANDLGFSDQFAQEQSQRFEDFLDGYEEGDDQEEAPAQNQGEQRQEPTMGNDAQADAQGEQQPQQEPAQDAQAEQEPAADQQAEPQADPAPEQEEPAQDAQDEPQAEQEPASPEAKAKKLVDDFKKSPVFQDVTAVSKQREYRNMAVANNYEWQQPADGSLIYVPEKKMQSFKEILQKNNDPVELARALHQAGLFTTWQQFMSIAGAHQIPGFKGSDKEVKLMRDALMAGADMYGKNYSKKLNRFLVAVPDAEEESKPFQLKESVIMEDLSDQELRDFFLKLAQKALKSGEARSAAKKQIRSIKKRKPNQAAPGAPQQAPAQTQAPAQNAPQQQRQQPPGAPTPQPAPQAAPAAQGAPKGLTVKLSAADKRVIDDNEGQDLIDMIRADTPDIEELTKRVMKAAIDNYKSNRS